MSDKTLLLNPSSKSGKGKKNWEYFLKQDFNEIVTNSEEHTIQSVIEADSETMVAVGGDGTINLVINGIMKSDKKKALGVLYSGTSPDFCKFHKIPINPKEALDVLNRANRELVDVMKITYLKDNSVAYFGSSCNIGLGAQIADISNKIRRFFGDLLGTLIAAIFAIISAKPFKALINIDGEKFELDNIYHVIVLKNNFIASGIHLNIETKTDDGKIYVLAIRKPLLKSLTGLYDGKIPQGAFLKCGKKVFVETTPKQKTEFDGDSKAETPVMIECLEKSLEIIK
ncbi:MAG: diacylglycerol kinase family protein [Candidatus Gastranaerophilales bacterium]|nr:diacylglycerol kinase family protein [Candidatus Gastranaerophilales bacterium]